jgi:hypothetical protein
MSTHLSLLFSGILSMALSAAPVQAHDPSEHQAESPKPDCAAMKDMDTSRMDMNDPVVKALQEKCRMAMQQDDGKHHSPDEKQPSGDDQDTPSDRHEGQH